MSLSKKCRKGVGNSKAKKEDFEPGSWECTVCTYRNRYEAFKCEICDTRKGTSTRKPRLNPSVVQQQTLVQNLAVQQSLGEQRALKRQRNSDSKSRCSPESNISGPSSSKSYTASNSQQNPPSIKMQSKNLSRKMIPFHDSLIVRSIAKKRTITVNNTSFTITEFKPKIQMKNRKKL